MDPRDKPSSDHDDEANMDTVKHQEDVAVDDYVPDTEEEKKLVRKIDLFLLPAIWGMYLLSYMVRTMFVTIPTCLLDREEKWLTSLARPAWATLKLPAWKPIWTSTRTNTRLPWLSSSWDMSSVVFHPSKRPYITYP